MTCPLIDIILVLNWYGQQYQLFVENIIEKRSKVIVEPDDYKKVQNEIINALMDMNDPETGENVVSLDVTTTVSRIAGLGVPNYAEGGVLNDIIDRLKKQHWNSSPYRYRYNGKMHA